MSLSKDQKIKDLKQILADVENITFKATIKNELKDDEIVRFQQNLNEAKEKKNKLKEKEEPDLSGKLLPK